MDFLTDAQLCEQSEMTSVVIADVTCFHEDLQGAGRACDQPASWEVRGYNGAFCIAHAAGRIRWSMYLRTPNDAPESGALSHHDRAALDEAAALIKDVLSRHPHEVHGQIMTAVQASVHGIDAVRRYLEEAR